MNIKKIITTCSVLILAGALLAVGIYAAIGGSTFSTKDSTVTFTATDAYVDITFGVKSGTNATTPEDTKVSAVTRATYVDDGSGNKSMSLATHAGEVTVNDVGLTEAKPFVVYTFTFTNVGSNAATIVITKDVNDIPAGCVLTATASRPAAMTKTTDKYEWTASIAGMSDSTNKTITVSIVLELKSFESNFDAHNMDFSVVLNKTAAV